MLCQECLYSFLSWVNERTYASASSPDANEVIRPDLSASSACFIASIMYRVGTSSNSFALKVIVFVLTNWRRNALRIELRLNPKSSAVFFACSFIFGSVLIKMLALFISARLYIIYILCQARRYTVISYNRFLLRLQNPHRYRSYRL